MKITCQSCQAKYTIADEKVLGKIVKIRCKKCSSTIVVNGSDPSGAASYGDPAAADQAGQVGSGDDAWTVNVGDGDQRTMTDADIVAAYQAGAIGAETFCWKDGMGDWLPLREIEALFDACNATRAIAPMAPEPARAPARGAPPPSATAPEAYAAASNGSSNGGAAHAAAARRAAGRAPGVDLFHGAAQAGGEEEVMTSAPVGAPQAYDEQKPAAVTGARNENSVLFSLSALTSKGGDRPPTVPGAEASGLIDIRQLSAQMGRGDDKKRSRVDDIMNLSSGGAFNGALSAPVLAAPAIDQYGPAAGPSGAPPEKSKGVIFLAIGAAAFVVVAAVGATFMLTHKGTDTDAAAASASAGGMVMPSATTATTATAATPSAVATAATPEPSATATDTAAAAAAPAATDTTTAPVAKAPAAAAPAAAPATPHAQQPAAAPVVHTAAPAAAAAPEAAEFNMGEAKAKLAAAAAAAQGCKKGDATGTGRVVVVFAPSGGAQTATISGPPFEGTPTGACVASRFKGVHVPPFSGSPFSVSKSFTIN
ncbi:MAG TPA: zinc-ribbon domain-containing protein [Polyangia bacterium]|jgi:predicted Zn finger-like uncharacterized protein|nr:zinc-ribbon domain-containing protein [Polyangia bacterium]